MGTQSAVLTAALLVGCIGAVDYPDPSARLQNATQSRIEVFVDTAQPLLLSSLDPGEEGVAVLPFGDDRCASAPLVARTVDGREVDRRDGAICVDELWIIDGLDE